MDQDRRIELLQKQEKKYADGAIQYSYEQENVYHRRLMVSS